MTTSHESLPISSRVAADDYAFLMAYPMPGKVTASEKLRHVVAFFRQYHESVKNYSECLNELNRLLQPAITEIKRIENESGQSSDLINFMTTALPEMTALLATVDASAGKGKDEAARLVRLEDKLTTLLIRLLENVLRLGLTRRSPTYNPALLRGRLETVSELADLLENQRASS